MPSDHETGKFCRPRPGTFSLPLMFFQSPTTMIEVEKLLPTLREPLNQGLVLDYIHCTNGSHARTDIDDTLGWVEEILVV